MEITREWLTEKGACDEGKEWFIAEGITDPVAGIRNLVAKGHWDWANWLIVRVMTRPQYLAYAIFAAEQTIDIYEKRNPDDKRPRKAIEASIAVLANDTEENRAAARAASGAAWAAARAAAEAAWAAARAAWAAARAAAEAAEAAWAAARAAWAAARAAAEAAWAAAEAAAEADCAALAAGSAGGAAETEMRLRIIEYGISLLEK